MRVIKNLGIDIPNSIERVKRSLQHAPKVQKNGYAAQAKKDFEYYSLPAKLRHPNYR